ncbi:MAG: cardiolipin synthase [Verrucomicrobiales bacterium]|nr:cardiolipin synthase [Verrucomicrobiales bacterium]
MTAWIDNERIWHVTGLAGWLTLNLVTSLHAVLYKRDSRATLLWVAFIWMSPGLGALAYGLVGINRIRRRAATERSTIERYVSRPPAGFCPLEPVARDLPPEAGHLEPLARLGEELTGRRLLPGNAIRPLVNGDVAYPQMLAAIRQATRSISLASYIFDNDPTGREFAAALGAAVRRGVTVRVLVDDAGARYSVPSILGRLRREGVRVARFMPRFILLRLAALNLRSHRKILVVDGVVGFTGGMNIRHGNRLLARPRYPVQDVHFRVEGPVVAHLQEAFVDDWAFCTGERLRGDAWFPELGNAGELLARGITDGPDEDLDRLGLTLNGAINAARHSIRLATPYFLPDATMVAALNTAALRGVTVEVLLPSRSNLPFVQWASMAHWWQVLQWGCEIWLTAPPFDHTKILLVDGCWALIGSSNIDPRSLRLNFEFNVEVYGRGLAAGLDAILDARKAGARRTSLAEMNRRPLPARLRDGIARLATPFL